MKYLKQQAPARLGYLLALFISSVPIAMAQQMNAETDLYYDSERNVVVVTTSTTVDYSTQYYYTPWAIVDVLDTNGYGHSDPGAWQTAYVEMNANPGDEVVAYGTHELSAEYETWEVTDCGCSGWYDAYGFDLIANTGNPTVDDPLYNIWVLYAPVVVTGIESQIISQSSGGRLRPTGLPGNFNVKVRAFIPDLYVHGPEPWCSFPGDAGVLYNGNHRTYNPISTSYKVHNSAMLLPGIGMGTLPVVAAGFTKRYQDQAVSVDGTYLMEDTVLHDCYLLDNVGQESTNGMRVDFASYVGQSVTTHMYGFAYNPLTPPDLTPSIDWDYWVTISAANPSSPQYSLSATHDCFPAWEAYIGATPIDNYWPVNSAPATIAYCLSGYGAITVNTPPTNFSY
jgi:hypothetical protein